MEQLEISLFHPYFPSNLLDQEEGLHIVIAGSGANLIQTNPEKISTNDVLCEIFFQPVYGWVAR